jgi:hypothetical protein
MIDTIAEISEPLSKEYGKTYNYSELKEKINQINSHQLLKRMILFQTHLMSDLSRTTPCHRYSWIRKSKD